MLCKSFAGIARVRTMTKCQWPRLGQPNEDTTIAKYSDIQGGWPGTGNIRSNPRFVDPYNGDFRLQFDSPCIDTGDPAYEIPINGGSRIDMGAYEYFQGFNYNKGSRPSVRHVPEEYPTIQDAIDACIYGDTVIVADGTYIGIGNRNINYQGKTITVRSENGAGSTIIDCEFDGRGFLFNNDEEQSSRLFGFTVINSDWSGGGVYLTYASPSIANCVFLGNMASGRGGAIHCWYSSPNISNCIFADNYSEDYGGAIYWYCSKDAA